MRTTWIVAADSARARIFEVEGVDTNFHELRDFVNEAGRERDQDLLSDAKSLFHDKGGRTQAPHTGEPHVDAVLHETELYAKQVCDYLEQARVEHRYDGLFLIAFPKFLGLLRENLSKEAQRLIENEVPKEISALEARDIESFYVKHRLH